MERILIILGSTGTGKTSLALHLAKVFDGEIISADSRQVYKGMDIGTGKDIPNGFEMELTDLEVLNKKIGFYSDGNTKIWGYDLISPYEEFSVAYFQEFARALIENIHERNRLPIVEGGTGLYIQSITEGIDTIEVPRNEKIRKTLLNKSPAELYSELLNINPEKALSLNQSDKNNPRRLIRAIEIEKYSGKNLKKIVPKNFNTLKIGLRLDKDLLYKKIEKRVVQRLDQGFEEEFNKLLDLGININSQSMTSLGYRQWLDYHQGKVSKEEAVKNWIREEKQYAKRQITWFKRDKEIKWFDANQKDCHKLVENLVKEWYKEKE